MYQSPVSLLALGKAFSKKKILASFVYFNLHFFCIITEFLGFPAASSGSLVKNLPAMQETQVQSLGQEATLQEEMATHFSILAWKILWTEEAWWATVHGIAESDIA